MIDQVIVLLPSGCVTLHAPRIGGGAAAAADLRGGCQASLRPVRAGLDDMAAALQRIGGCLGYAVLDHKYAGPRRARPERDREMFGMPGRRVDRFLQIEFGVDVPQEELRVPLVLL